MSEIVLHTKLVDGEYLEAPEPRIVVHVHDEHCLISECSCEPTVKEAEILI